MTQEKGLRESIQSRNIHQLPDFLSGLPGRTEGDLFFLLVLEEDSTWLTENTVVFHSGIVKESLSGVKQRIKEGKQLYLNSQNWYESLFSLSP